MMQRPRRFPIGIQSFRKIIKGNYAYVDKTALVHRLANYGNCFFLSRPRRFGKSLLVSTLDAYFKGQKELFTGLAMEQLETEWKQYPVLRLDLNDGDYSESGTEALIDKLDTFLQENEQLYGYESPFNDLVSRFHTLVNHIVDKTGKQVVILIDEYDKPLLETINDEELNKQMRGILRGFLATIKSQDENIHFALLTGVSRFSEVTIFNSGLNNLIDISMVEEFADICGITEQELHDNFDNDVQLLADKNGMTKQQAYDKLHDNYGGYHFESGSEEVYNPFSVMNALDDKMFHDYWSSTGTPSFLVEALKLKQGNYNLAKLNDEVFADPYNLAYIDTHKKIVPMMYMSGYLTIKDSDPDFRFYRLGFPNGEVQRAFNDNLMPLCSKT